MNVSQQTINVCYELIGECFQFNRILDRAVSILGVKFAMNNTAKLLHGGYAHLFPQISDKIGEKCLEAYNIPVEYEHTDAGKQDYNSVKEIIELVEKISVDFQSMLSGAIIVAQENEDIQVYVELCEILKEFNPYVAQSILLVDKLNLYGDALYSYDAHITDHFWEV